MVACASSIPIITAAEVSDLTYFLNAILLCDKFRPERHGLSTEVKHGRTQLSRIARELISHLVNPRRKSALLNNHRGFELS